MLIAGSWRKLNRCLEAVSQKALKVSRMAVGRIFDTSGSGTSICSLSLMIQSLRRCFLSLMLLTVVAAVLPCCRKHKSGDRKPDAKPTAPEAKRLAPHPTLPAPVDDVSKEIEGLTAAHTRVVWNECVKPNESDPYSHGDQQVLRGIDTRDGLGERTILAKEGNYSRPVITHDGKAILYSWRRMVRSKGQKDYVVTVLRTDWSGSPPEELAAGYVVDAWRDPATGVDWVYCTRKYRSIRGPGLVARQLWRFQLDSPKKAEIVFDDTRLTPDNIQISRDGKLACGLFPWPQGGVVHLDSDPPRVQKLSNGCWTSAAPDLSGVSWVFDGSHKGATFFADDGARSWYVNFDAPCAKQGETYHPRWTNHPRFMVLTGPYVPDSSGVMAVPSDRNLAEVYLGRFTADAQKTEAWVKVSRHGKPTAYPDAWIEGGEKADLNLGAAPAKKSEVSTGKWPSKPEGLVFLWRDRKSLNEWKGSSGHTHSADMEAKGAARYGRYGELVFDGGVFEIEDDEEAPALAALKTHDAGAFQAVLTPCAADAEGWLLRTPSFSVYQRKGSIIVLSSEGKAYEGTSENVVKAVHLCVNRKGSEFEVMVNGSRLPITVTSPPAVEPVRLVTLGAKSLKRGMLNVAIYDRALSDEEIAGDAATLGERLGKLQSMPVQIRVVAKLVEISKIPTLESIQPYSSALLNYVYEVEKVLAGELPEKRILVKHWGLLNKATVQGYPRQVGGSYEMVIEREADHTELQGERVSDDTTAFDLVPWFDVGTPVVKD